MEENLEKKETKKIKSLEERILLKKQELELLEKAYTEKQKKDKNKWIGNILKPVKEELEKIYEKDNQEKDLGICTAIIYAIEHYKELAELAGIENYVMKTKTTSRIVRVNKEEVTEEIKEIDKIEKEGIEEIEE